MQIPAAHVLGLRFALTATHDAVTRMPAPHHHQHGPGSTDANIIIITIPAILSLHHYHHISSTPEQRHTQHPRPDIRDIPIRPPHQSCHFIQSTQSNTSANESTVTSHINHTLRQHHQYQPVSSPKCPYHSPYLKLPVDQRLPSTPPIERPPHKAPALHYSDETSIQRPTGHQQDEASMAVEAERTEQH